MPELLGHVVRIEPRDARIAGARDASAVGTVAGHARSAPFGVPCCAMLAPRSHAAPTNGPICANSARQKLLVLRGHTHHVFLRWLSELRG